MSKKNPFLRRDLKEGKEDRMWVNCEAVPNTILYSEEKGRKSDTVGQQLQKALFYV